MKLTLQAADVHRFRKLASTLVAGPRGFKVQLLEYRGKLAMTVGGADWTLVMPVRGRRTGRQLQIPLAAIWNLPAAAEGKIIVQIEDKKGFGKILWYEDGWDESAPFPFGLGDFAVVGLPPEASESQKIPTSLLSELAKCSRICRKAWPTNLGNVQITPGGEIGATNGKRLLLLETEHRFTWPEPILVPTSKIYAMKELRERESFGMSVRDGWVRLDFGNFLLFSWSDVERFPKLRRVLPTDDKVRTRLIVAPKDATFLKKHLRGRKTTEITLFCSYDKTVSVHRPELPTLILAHSHFEGDAAVLQTEQGHLIDAISNGCLEFRFAEPYPAAFGAGKTYCWVPTELSILPLESEFPQRSTLDRISSFRSPE